jgi:hypothetical protein
VLLKLIEIFEFKESEKWSLGILRLLREKVGIFKSEKVFWDFVEKSREFWEWGKIGSFFCFLP